MCSSDLNHGGHAARRTDGGEQGYEQGADAGPNERDDQRRGTTESLSQRCAYLERRGDDVCGEEDQEEVERRLRTLCFRDRCEVGSIHARQFILTTVMTLVLALVFALVMMPGLSAQAPAPPSILVLQPDRVFDGEQLHTGWMVVVRGDRIEAAGPVAAMTIPAGARTIVLKGTTVMPGLIEGHSHMLLHPYNETVWNDLADAGILDMVPKTNYPLDVPQAPTDLKPPVVNNGQTVKQGMWLTDWSGSPVSTNYLGMGNVDVNGPDMILRGWLFNAGLADVKTAQVFGNTYFGPTTEAGARKIAHEYAADILKQMGAVSLAGSKIYFVSDRTGKPEIWSMDYDGQNQQRMTNHASYTKMPTVSPDGKLVAYVTMANLT